MEEGGGYALPTIDPATRQLLKMEVFDKDSRLKQVCTYEYDNAPGSASWLNLPMWFAGWWNYSHAYSSNFEDVQFLNFNHNITRITFEDKEENTVSSVTYTYKYNENGFPASVTCNDGEKKTEVSILY